VRMERLNVPSEMLNIAPVRGGSSSQILYSEAITRWLEDRYHISGLCLKVFPRLTNPLDEWEFVPLAETAIVQNLFALAGWAPQMHALVSVQGGPMAEVVEFAERLDETPPDREALAPFWALIDRHGIGTRSRVGPDGALKWDFIRMSAARNWSRRRLLDWGGKYRRAMYPQWDEPQPERVVEE